VIRKLQQPPPTVIHGQRKQRDPITIVVYPLVRPKIDYDKFARALLLLAKEQRRDEDSAMAGR
jgi:hypothetical protein